MAPVLSRFSAKYSSNYLAQRYSPRMLSWRFCCCLNLFYGRNVIAACLLLRSISLLNVAPVFASSPVHLNGLDTADFPKAIVALSNTKSIQIEPKDIVDDSTVKAFGRKNLDSPFKEILETEEKKQLDKQKLLKIQEEKDLKKKEKSKSTITKKKHEDLKIRTAEIAENLDNRLAEKNNQPTINQKASVDLKESPPTTLQTLQSNIIKAPDRFVKFAGSSLLKKLL